MATSTRSRANSPGTTPQGGNNQGVVFLALGAGALGLAAFLLGRKRGPLSGDPAGPTIT